MSPGTYAQLVSSDDHEAFDTYLALRQQAIRECSAPPAPPNSTSSFDRYRGKSLLAVLEDVVRRPAMYFGNECSTPELYAFCNGFLWAERDLGSELSDNARLLQAFQEWLDKRYPFARGRPWGHTFHFLRLGNREWAFASFAEHLGMFVSGEHPDAIDRTERQIAQNILQYAKRDKGTVGKPPLNE